MNVSFKDPVVSKQRAIEKAGTRANLARLLNVTRTCVTDWHDYLPPLQAYRLIQIFPDLPEIDEKNNDDFQG